MWLLLLNGCCLAVFLAPPVLSGENGPQGLVVVATLIWQVSPSSAVCTACTPYCHMLCYAVPAGSITPKPQPGNDKPRVFRIPELK